MAFPVIPLIIGDDGQLQNLSGVDVNVTASNRALKIINEDTQFAISVCETNCTELTENISVIVSPGSYTGPIIFTQSCQITDVNCAINALVNQGIQTTLQQINDSTFNAKITQKPLFNITSEAIKTTTSLNETIKNNIYQMISSSCLFQTNQRMENNYVYVGTGATTGAISFIQSSTISTTDCAIDAIAKANSYNQEIPSTSPDLLILVIIAIVVILVIGVVFVILFLVTHGDHQLAAFFRGNKEKNAAPELYKQANTPVVIVHTDYNDRHPI